MNQLKLRAMLANPFEIINEKLSLIEEKINNLPIATGAPQFEIVIVTRDELCKRLRITKATVIRYEKKGKIPSIRIGSSVRYNLPTVIKALERKPLRS